MASEQPASSVGDAFENLGEELSRAVRTEVERVREELSARLEAAGRGATLLAGAGALGGVAGGALLSLPLLALRRVLPGWAVALLVGGGAAAGAAVLARRGLRELRVAAPEGVEQELADASEELAASLRRRVTGSPS